VGSITNLKTNKTLFIPCNCYNEILYIEYDHEIEIAEFAIYESRSSYEHKRSIWQRLRYCYNILFKKKPYSDQIILDNKQLSELKSFLVRLGL
jgi:hypothetical protein